ncbi:hypothetical protein D3C76_1434560 [compost metagenome]
MRTGVGDPQSSRLGHDSDGRTEQHQQWRYQNRDGHHLHLVGFDFLTQVLGRAADHQAGDKHCEDGEHQHAIQA